MKIARFAMMALVASLITFGATAAQALVVFSNATIGRQATVTYIGSVNGSPTTKIGATTIYKLTSISANQKDWTFSYSVTNTSSVSSRLRSFGFDATGLGTDPTKPIAITGLSATGMYATPGTDNNFPEGFGTVEVCFRATGGSNCTGGPNGATKGVTATGLFTIKFKDAPLTLTLDRFVTRFQSIAPKINGGDSGIGKQDKIIVINADGSPGPVPEPAQWLMLIGGFGTIGATLRRRRSKLLHA